MAPSSYMPVALVPPASGSPRTLAKGSAARGLASNPVGDEGSAEEEGAGGSSDGSEDSEAEYEGEPLDEDLYGVCIASLLRDSSKLASCHGNVWLRAGRLFVTIFMMVFLVALQAFLVVEMKLKVTPKSVLDTRELYDKYESHMYNGATVKTPNGFNRGLPGHLDTARYATLGKDVQDSICAIPLAHPVFFAGMLLVWTLTVIADIRRIAYLVRVFLVYVPPADSLGEMFSATGTSGRIQKDNDGKVVLRGLTMGAKVALLLFVFLPRFLLDLVLLWLGSRWLVSTSNLSDVFLNAVALEFILCLKDLVYTAVIPPRSKMETQEMLIPVGLKEQASCCAFFGSFIWLLSAFAWVVLYIYHLQRVLPDYRWDVREVCNAHM